MFEQIGPIHLSTTPDRVCWPLRLAELAHLPVVRKSRGPSPTRRNHEQPHPRRPVPRSPREELLTLDEVTEILTASPNTVRGWRQTGTGPELFKIGWRLYTTVGDLRRYIREQRLASKPVIGRPKAV
jgi:hypothetical protein